MHVSPDELIDVLRRDGLRITEPRRLVCEVVATRHHEHLTAAAIYDIVRTDSDGDLDRATVYRTLDALESAGVIKHGHIGHGPTVYHLAEESSHQHVVCDTCGTIQSIDDDSIAPLIAAIESGTGFRIDVEHFALSGRCESCVDGSA